MSADSVFERRKREIRAEGTAVPFDFDALERGAADALPDGSYAFAASAAGRGATRRANASDFERWRIVPRVLRDVADRDLSVDLFGRTLDAPVTLAPIGMQTAYDEAGELASARAAAALNVPFALSTPAGYSIEDVAEAVGDAPRYFQLYWTADRDVAASLVSRAEDAGYDAIHLTVDFQTDRWTPETLADTDTGLSTGRLANLETDPVAVRTGEETEGVGRDESLTWDDLGFIRERTDLPLVVKGIVHPTDARLAVEHGADGIVVSNHGGRQIDGSISTIRALPPIVEAVGDDATILLDGGVRGGADAFKALALGADAVSIGRPYIYGLALAGERGVYEVTHNLLAELDTILGLAGYTDVTEVDGAALHPVE